MKKIQRFLALAGCRAEAKGNVYAAGSKQKETYRLCGENFEAYTFDFIFFIFFIFFILFILFIRDTGQDWETGRQLGTDTGLPGVRTTRMKRMK